MDDVWGRGCSAAAGKLFPTALPPHPYTMESAHLCLCPTCTFHWLVR